MSQLSQRRIWQTTQWGVWMLAFSVFLNYVDRGALSIAMPQMRGELSLNQSELGLLASMFFWTYALMQIPSRWLVERFDVKWVLAAGFAVWSLATGLTGIAKTFSMLLAFRLILGIGESVAYPAYSRIIATRFPPESRGFPNALIDAFSKFGPALSTLVGGLVVAKFGWRPFFLFMGIGGMIWLLPWLSWTWIGMMKRVMGRVGLLAASWAAATTRVGGMNMQVACRWHAWMGQHWAGKGTEGKRRPWHREQGQG